MFRKLVSYSSLLILFLSCNNGTATDSIKNVGFNKFEKELSIELNNNWVKDEAFKIDQYCLRQGFDTKITKSGLRYLVIKNSENKFSPSPGDDVILSYDVRLMDPNKTRCYHSDSNGLAKFKIEQAMVESGLHEVVTYLNKGDSALVILPHYLAHGVTGDSRKIPPLASVLYYIKLIDVIK